MAPKTDECPKKGRRARSLWWRNSGGAVGTSFGTRRENFNSQRIGFEKKKKRKLVDFCVSRIPSERGGINGHREGRGREAVVERLICFGKKERTTKGGLLTLNEGKGKECEIVRTDGLGTTERGGGYVSERRHHSKEKGKKEVQSQESTSAKRTRRGRGIQCLRRTTIKRFSPGEKGRGGRLNKVPRKS